MSAVFQNILNLSIKADWLILAVILARFLLKKAPKRIICVLWLIVAVRLVCPFSLESNLSLVPNILSGGTIINQWTDTSFEKHDYFYVREDFEEEDVYNTSASSDVSLFGNDYIPTSSNTDNEYQKKTQPETLRASVVSALPYVWIAGTFALLLYALFGYLKLKKSVGASIAINDNTLYCDDIQSPYILGIIKPMIYIPSSLTGDTLKLVLTHEKAHLKRHDHCWKPFGFFLLAVYWINPLCWLGYILLCRDIEMACDERVIHNMDNESKAAYSQALLNCSFPRKRIAACTLSFGEVDVKERVQSVLYYKKPSFWIVTVAITACLLTAICFLTNPISKNTLVMGADYNTKAVYTVNRNNAVVPKEPQQYCITADYHLYSKGDAETDADLTYLGKLIPYNLTAKELKGYINTADKQTRKLFRKITDAYKLSVSENYFYLVFQTKDGKTYLSYGWEDVAERGQNYSDDTEIFRIYLLESSFRDGVINVYFIERSLENAIGCPVYNFSNFESDRNPGYHISGFKYGSTDDYSQMNSLGFAVFQSKGTGYRMIDVKLYENAALADNGIFYCPDSAVADINGEIRDDNAFDIIMILNDDVNKVERVYYKDNIVKKVLTDDSVRAPYMSVWSWEYSKRCNSVSQWIYDKYGNSINYNSVIPEVPSFGNGLSQNADFSGVRIIEKVSDTNESYYQVGATLNETDFSLIGQILADKIAQDWARYDSMTQEQKMISSHAPGFITLGFDNWNDCETAIGFSVINPLESLDWLNKTGYIGSESSNPDMPVQFIRLNANAANTDRQLTDIYIDSGYTAGNVHITLNATLSAHATFFAGERAYTSVYSFLGYTSFDQYTVSTGSGIPVLMVPTDMTNNKEIYNESVYDVRAYWAQGNVFYTLRLFGDKDKKDEINAVLEKILEEI